MEQEGENNSIIEKVSMFIRKNPAFVGLVSIGVILLTIGAIQYLNSNNTKDEAVFIPENTKAVAGTSSATEILIDVEGAVQKPGVYKLKEGARIQEALIAAGGMSSTADREYVSKHVNLAQKVIDSGKIYIPSIGEGTATNTSVSLQSTSNNGQNVSTNNEGLININSASADTLDALPKVGPVTAQKIINGRPYSMIDELVSKKILTQKTYDGLKDKITTE